MPRLARLDAPGALHYIIVRGIERWSMFVDAQDYQNFLERSGNFLRDGIKSQSRRRVVARSSVVISIVATGQLGFGGADVARTLNLNPSSISKLISRARNDPALKDGVKDALNLS
jgi:hypothetical protein